MHIFVIFVGIGTTTWLNALKIVTLRLKVALFGRNLISNSKIKLSLQLQFVLLQSCRKQIKLHSVLRLSKFTFKMHWRSKDYYFSQYVLITYNTKLCSLSLMLWLNQSTFLIPNCKVVLVLWVQMYTRDRKYRVFRRLTMTGRFNFTLEIKNKMLIKMPTTTQGLMSMPTCISYSFTRHYRSVDPRIWTLAKVSNWPDSTRNLLPGESNLFASDFSFLLPLSCRLHVVIASRAAREFDITVVQ